LIPEAFRTPFIILIGRKCGRPVGKIAFGLPGVSGHGQAKDDFLEQAAHGFNFGYN